MIKQPKFVIITHICTRADPTFPNDSPITPEYVVESPAWVYLIRNSTDISASQAITTIRKNAGTTPNTLIVAGIDIIPAPMMLVETLNTAPDTDACFPGLLSGSSGTFTPAAGDILER